MNNLVKKYMDRLTKPQTHVDKKKQQRYYRQRKHKGDTE